MIHYYHLGQYAKGLLSKLKQCQKLGLKEIPFSELAPGMIIYGEKPKLSRTGHGYCGYHAFPKNHVRYRVVAIGREGNRDFLEVREVGKKKVFGQTYYEGCYVWVKA